jgi:HK97 family phage prohead protease
MATTTEKLLESRMVKGIEIREAKPGSGSVGTIVGYAATFNELSLDLGFREKIAPGAFKASLARGDDVRALIDHNPERIIGRRSSSTLRVTEDEKGLWVEIDLPDTQAGRDILASIKRGDVTGQSFSFYTIADDWKRDPATGLWERTLLAVDAVDVGPVTFPAYPTTSIAARSLTEVFKRATHTTAPAGPMSTEAKARRDALIGRQKALRYAVDRDRNTI